MTLVLLADEDAAKKAVRGHFDLRNIVEIAPVDSVPNAVRLRIAERSVAAVKKSMVISFELDPSRRGEWLTAWCSAISQQYVSPELSQHILLPLVTEYNMKHAMQSGVGSRRSLLKSSAPQTPPLTPRDDVVASAAPPSAPPAATPPAPLPAPQAACPAALPLSSASSSSTSSLDTASLDTASLDTASLDTPRETAQSRFSAPPPELVSYEVTVPPEAVAGDKLKMVLPQGQEVQITIPHGATSGAILTFELPVPRGEAGAEKAAVLIQARIRGAQARKSVSSRHSELGCGSEGGAPSDALASGTVHVIEADAAGLIQATIRGKTARRNLADGSTEGSAVSGRDAADETAAAGEALESTPGFGECARVHLSQAHTRAARTRSAHGHHTRPARSPPFWSNLYPACAAARFEHSRHGPNLSGPQSTRRG